MNYTTAASCGGTQAKQGQIAYNLDTLNDRVNYTHKLIAEIFEVIEIPRPQETCNIGCGIPVPTEQTLAQKIYNIDYKVDTNNGKLQELINILRDQLGSEKLI